MELENSQIHVVLLPWSAFGHIMPFYQLAVGLAKAGVKVSFVQTPKNLERLPKPPPAIASLINQVALPLPVVESSPLPAGAEASVDVPGDQVLYLHLAYALLKQPFKQFVSESSPDWLIIDFVPHWAADVARDCGVRLLSFSAFSAASKVYFGPPEYLSGEGQKRVRSTIESLTSPPPWVDFPSSVAYRPFEAIEVLARFFGINPTGQSVAAKVGKVLRESQAVAIRSCAEIEGEYLTLFAKLLGKPVIPVGLLPPETPKRSESPNGLWTETFKWLDEEKPRSVVFVGFGSECKLNKEQIHEIACGLESSDLPFLWILRKPDWATDNLDALPPGYTDRTTKRGKVCFGWAPQMEILAHPSVGGSLFHAGWGSVIETLQFGHALVVLPLIIDQPLNARMLVDKGLAIEVARGEDGSFRGEDIAKALIRAMADSEEGEGMRARLREAGKMAGDRKLQDHHFDEFVKYLRKGGGA